MNPKKSHYDARLRELRGDESRERDLSGVNLEALKRERNHRVGEMRAIVEDAGEKFSRADGEKCRALDAEIREMDEEIAEIEAHERGEAIDGRSTQAPIRRDESGSIALRSEERIADRIASRGFGHDGDGGEFSLGKVVGALIGKVDRRSLSDAETRALAEGTDAAGGYLVPEILSARMIDRARNKAAVIRAGALTVPMGAAEVHLARLSGGNTAAWKLEGDPIQESDQAFERVTLKAKTLPVLMRLSAELFEDMSPEGHALVESEIVSSIALELDRAALRGSGVDPEPRGVRNQAGVNIVDMGTDGATPADWDWLIDAISAVWAANGEPNAAVYSARTATTLAKLKDTTGQPLRRPEAVAALNHFVSNQIRDDLDKGTSTGVASEGYVGDFASLLIGVRPTMSIRFHVLGERYAENLQIGLLAYLRADVALAHPDHFAIVDGILA